MNIKELVGELSDKELEFKNTYYNETKKMVNEKEVTWNGLVKTGHRYLKIAVEHWNLAYVYSLARKVENERAGLIDRYCGDNAIKGEILGLLNEVIVAEFLDLDFDRTTQPRSGGFDAVYENCMIDFKICMPKNNDKDMVVVAQSKKLSDCNCYWFSKFIVDKEGNQYIDLYSWSKSSDIIKEENKIPGRKGYWLSKKELKKFKVI